MYLYPSTAIPPIIKLVINGLGANKKMRIRIGRIITLDTLKAFSLIIVNSR